MVEAIFTEILNPYRRGTPFEMFKNLKFPMEMELLIGRTTNSSGKETAVVKDVRFQVVPNPKDK